MSALDFTGQVALVTGAARGLGAAYAERLARAGAAIAINDRSDKPEAMAALHERAEALRALGGAVLVLPAHVGVEEEAEGLVEATVREFGKIDILINNAGGGNVGPLHEQHSTQLRKLFETHVFGTFWTMRAAIPHMRKAGYGRIVNTGSSIGAFGCPNLALYAGAKGAIISMTRSVAQEHLDIELRANVIAPTALTGLSQGIFAANPKFDAEVFEPRRVAPLVTWLCHPSCKLNGEVLTSGGGRHARIWTSTSVGIMAPDIEDGEFQDLRERMFDRAGAVEPYNSYEEFNLVCS